MRGASTPSHAARPRRSALALGTAGLICGVALGCAGEGAASDARTVAEAPGADAAPTVEGLDTIPGTVWTADDWRILTEKIRWADENGLDTLPVGDAIAALGRTFEGWTYTPATLEAPGDEHIVVNLRELDCVTFIENVWALTQFHRAHGVDGLDDPAVARAAYEGYLEGIRYRDGRLDRYPSRLHYFSDWLWNHEDRGHLTLVTADLGGVPDDEPIDFMSTHPDAYAALANGEFLRAIRAREVELNARGPRVYLPQSEIGAVEDRIRDGDIIAATSTVSGLDIAHTGIALWQDGRLHLLHAPLVGKNVEISEAPLADRILGISGQDGILVARLTEER